MTKCSKCGKELMTADQFASGLRPGMRAVSGDRLRNLLDQKASIQFICTSCNSSYCMPCAQKIANGSGCVKCGNRSFRKG